jgi:hypothetical protein
MQAVGAKTDWCWRPPAPWAARPGKNLDEGPIAVPLGTQSAVDRVRGVYQLRGEVPAWKQQP